MKKINVIILLFIVSFIGIGCEYLDPVDKFHKMKPPIIVVAESKLGTVTLCDSENTIVTIPFEYYVATTISNTYNPGDTLEFLKGEKQNQ